MALHELPAFQAVASAFLLKLTTSLDDLLWLSPFLSLSPSVPNKLKHSVVYFIICVFVTMMAFIFGTTLLTLMSDDHEGSKEGGYWKPERLLSVFSASVLFFIARRDYNEWKEEQEEASTPREETTFGGTVVEMTGPSTPPKLRSRSNTKKDVEVGEPLLRRDSNDDDDDDDDEEIRAKIEDASKSLKRFVAVCVMGTIDDMIVFSAFVAGSGGMNNEPKHNSYIALFIGTTFAALFIVTVSWFFSEIECFKRMVKKIPMWGLLTGIALYILVMGLL